MELGLRLDEPVLARAVAGEHPTLTARAVLVQTGTVSGPRLSPALTDSAACRWGSRHLAHAGSQPGKR